MGAIASQCGVKFDRSLANVGALLGSGDSEDGFVLEVLRTDVDDSQAAKPSGFKVSDQLVIPILETPPGLEPLGFRYRDAIRAKWPDDYRFQSIRRSWRALVAQGLSGHQACVLQMASNQEERTSACVSLDLEDAKTAASYAHRFNLYNSQHAMQTGMAGDDPLPRIKVAAPVSCRILKSSLPALIPVGAYCTLTPYAEKEVKKFVFDGSEDFLEMAQAFFHHAAFSSGGKELVCDIQGVEEEDGSLLLIDPCVLHAAKTSVGGLIKGAVANATAEKQAQDQQASLSCMVPDVPSSADHFDALHPRCAQLCKAFDPQRKSVTRKLGVCGIDVTCGLGK
eukprot:TRINITY_DN11575_c1_g1_i1.p1 TRINITY_DN11575_c1_g1~~TRINITY_DN11575_c1_g1_i1.p1  ORF type:complete len:338 (-),score=56.78 TRINITY_DN11575_c1_g1_i1:88-1101(-)